MACPQSTRKLLNSTKWIGKTGELGTKMIDLQLNIYNESIRMQKRMAESSETPSDEKNVAPTTSTPITTLFDLTAETLCHLFEEDPENVDTMIQMSNPGLARAAWKWHTIPYVTFCSLRVLGGSDDKGTEKTVNEEVARISIAAFEKDVDIWILRNEEWLRRRMRTRPEDGWRTGLITFDTMQQVIQDSILTTQHRRISRPKKMDGFTCLDAKRSPSIHIQPSDNAFGTKLNELSHGQLNGLDWSNIFVAGGIILGSLLCVDSEEAVQHASPWAKSDIDIYIHGLNPSQVNKKIQHLFDVFKSNLPSDVQDSIIAVKNSKTITFLAPYPHRRFQIILKLVKNPAEVLLNFDLDICAMGYDGDKLYMLPRAIRALETGYNTFTMDMVQGHYLGERRASQEKRVFKYANKGYGIRFLPSYIKAHNALEAARRKHEEENEIDRNHRNEDRLRPDITIEPISSSKDINLAVARSRDYFERVFQTYMSWTNNGVDLRRHYADGKSLWEGSKAELPAKTSSGKKIGGRDGIPIFTHALLDTIEQISPEPLRRSCLTGFPLFFRHVALWEAEQQERLYIQDDVWASTTYDDTQLGVSYDDLPQYPWDETFSSKDFLERVEKFNRAQADSVGVSLFQFRDSTKTVKRDVQRIIAGKGLEEVLFQNLMIPIWMPPTFVDYADKLIKSVATDHPDLAITTVLEVFRDGEKPIWSFRSGKEEILLVNFRLSPTMMYQQLDRRLDELYEVIWSFMHAYQLGPDMEETERTHLFLRQLSNRSIRSKKSWKEEVMEFSAWLRRDPGPIGGYHYGSIGQGFWWDVNGEEGGESDWDDDTDGEDYDDFNPFGFLYRHYSHEEEEDGTDTDDEWVTTSGEDDDENEDEQGSDR